jgi:polar amino acid transport system permease protein
VSTTVPKQGAGATRLPAYSAEVPSGAIFELLAAWTLLTEGALALVFLPIIVFAAETNLPPPEITAFGALGVACLVAGGLLYTRFTWAWFVAFAAAVGAPAWLLASGGLLSSTEAYAATALSAFAVMFLVIGRRAAGNTESLALASARIPFRLKLALVWLAIFFVIGVFFALSDFDVQWMRENIGYIAGGIQFTLLLAVSAIILAVTLALLGALGRLSHNPVAYGVAGFYTSFFRGTPLIVQLFLLYLALPQIGSNLGSRSLLDVLTLTTFQVGIIGLGLNYGAYMTEIFRAGIQSVGHGQAEAAEALGMSYPQRMRRVVLPQAIRVIIPPTGNEFIAMMKDTALVSIIGSEISRAEIFRRAQVVGNADFRRLESLIVAAAMYWGLTAVFTFFQSRLERRLSKGYIRAAGSARDRRPKMFSLGAGVGAGGAHLPAATKLGEELEEGPPP